MYNKKLSAMLIALVFTFDLSGCENQSNVYDDVLETSYETKIESGARKSEIIKSSTETSIKEEYEQEIISFVQTTDQSINVTNEDLSSGKNENFDTVVINGHEIRTDCERLFFCNDDLNDENIDKLIHFTELKQLELENTSITNFEVLGNLDKLELLGINKANSEKLLDLSPLLKCKSLKKLILNAANVNLNSISKLSNLELLSLSRIDTNDIDFIKDFNSLKAIYLYMTGTEDITALCELKELKEVHIEYCTEIKNLKPLGDLVALEKLYLGRNDYFNDLSVLSALQNLNELSINVCLTEINNISQIKNMTKLINLELGNVNISDISELETFYELVKLETLNFRSHLPVEDIDQLKTKLPNTKIKYEVIMEE